MIRKAEMRIAAKSGIRTTGGGYKNPPRGAPHSAKLQTLKNPSHNESSLDGGSSSAIRKNHWNAQEFILCARGQVGTAGNSSPAHEKALELTEILSLRLKTYWNEWKFLLRAKKYTGTDGNSSPSRKKTLELAEIHIHKNRCGVRRKNNFFRSFQ